MIPPFVMMIVLKGIGVLIGYLLTYLDAIGYALYLHPESPESAGLKGAVAQKNIGLIVQETRMLLHQPLRFIHRGILFFGAFVVLAVFMLTSASSAIGHGIVAGFGLHILLAMIPYRKDLAALKGRFFLGLSATAPPATLLTLILVLAGLVVLAVLA